jgi:hypothetical protein
MSPRDSIPIPAPPISGSIISLPSGIQIVTTIWGVPAFFAASGTTTPSSTTTVLSIVGLAMPIIRSISQIILVCPIDAKFDAKIGSSIIASGYTRPGKSESIFPFAAPREIAASDTIVVRLIVPSWTPAGADYEIYVTCGDRDTTA